MSSKGIEIKEIVQTQQEAERLERLNKAKERLRQANMTREELYIEKRAMADEFNRIRREQREKERGERKELELEENLMDLWNASEGKVVDKGMLEQLVAGLNGKGQG